jgi:aspartokinase
METIAVYWEPQIRIYGVTTVTGLSLYTVVFPADRMAHWGAMIASLGQAGVTFHLVNLQPLATGEMRFSLIFAADGREREVHRLFEAGTAESGHGAWRQTSPVEMVYLHGPHFQDRYGIAEAAIAPVLAASIPLLASGCSGTSIHLVVPEHCAGKVVDCLGGTFVIENRSSSGTSNG